MQTITRESMNDRHGSPVLDRPTTNTSHATLISELVETCKERDQWKRCADDLSVSVAHARKQADEARAENERQAGEIVALRSALEHCNSMARASLGFDDQHYATLRSVHQHITAALDPAKG